MAGVNISNSGLLFTRYLEGVTETLNQESKARNLIKQEDRWTGSHIEGTLHTARSTALRYTEDGGAFPAADKQDYVRYKAYRKFLVGSIQLSDGVMAAASKSKNVAKDVVSSEVEGMMTGLLKFENGMFFRDGTGIVARFGTDATAAAGATFTVDDARMLWDGAEYDVYDATAGAGAGSHGTAMAATPVLLGSFVVTSVASAPTAAGEFTVTATTAVPGTATASNDAIVWKGSVNRAITGLDKLIDDSLTGTFQGVTTATYPRYSSFVLDNSGTNRDLTPTLFRQMLAGIYQKSGNEKPAAGLKCLTSSWGAINVEELYEGELRLTPDSKVAGLAVAAFQTALGRVDIITDSDALYHKMFFIDPSEIYRAVQKPLAWRREEGGGIFKRSDTAGVWTATCMEIAEMYIKRRNTSGKIEDLNEDIRTAY